MTKISKKSAYPIKIPVRKDYFVGSDSENNGKTINFDFESGAKLIGEINGSTALSYRFRTDSNIDLTVLTEGVFLSAENETTIANISKLYINKNNFNETNMSDLFRFVSVNRESFLMKLRNSSNLSNSVYFRITDATEFESYFILDVAVEMNNASLPELTNFNVYFFDFELSSSDLAITLPEFNKIVNQTGYTSAETTITFNPSWTWLIKNVSYENSASVVKTIAPTTTGKKRIDVFVLNTSNTFETISGEETTGSPVKPQIPADTLEVTFCIVGDTGIDSVEPIDLSSYATIDYVNAKDALLSNRITTLEEGDSGVGLPIAITDVTGLTEELADRYTKSEVDAKVSSVYKFKGNVANYAALPATGLTIGDVYNLLDTGANYAWTGTVWDKLGDTIDISGKEDSSNKSQDIETDKTSTTKYASVKQLYDWAVAKFQAVLVSGTNIKTINGNSILGSGDITVSAGGAGDMTTTTDQTVSGIKTFLAGKLGFRNVANTFTSFFTNTNTASRTYTFQNKDYTVADNADLAGKMANPTGGIVNYLPKFLTGGITMGLSRLWDTGTFFGIGTAYTPTKDITLGNQANREIGVEESPNTVGGRNLIIRAGRAINYVPNSNFNSLNQQVGGWGITSDSLGNVYFRAYGGTIYKQTGGTGSFVSIGSSGASGYDIEIAVNGDIYMLGNGFSTGHIYMQTGGIGAFNIVTTTQRNWFDISAHVNGDIYVVANDTGRLYKRIGGSGDFILVTESPTNIKNVSCSSSGDVYVTGNNKLYKQTGGTGSFNDLLQTSRDYRHIDCAPNGNVYVYENNGDIFSLIGGSGNLVGLNQFIAGVSGICFVPNGNAYIVTPSEIYFQNNDALGTANLDGGTKSERAGTGKGTGKSWWEVWTGQKTTSGTDMQLETLRLRIDESGNVMLFTDKIFANNDAAIAGGLPAKTIYWTSTGEMRIVV